MTDTDALDNLIKAVEAGTATRKDFKDAIPPWGPAPSFRLGGAYMQGYQAMEEAYSGSLDAALALHEALLPGWALDRVSMWPGGECYACLMGTHDEYGERWHSHGDGRVEATSSTPARAWLLAILRAYRATLTK